MEPDFRGTASKANLLCADGRVILPNAFQHQDGEQVPLVWGHRHNDVKQVLGHAVLRVVGGDTLVDAYFNDTDAGQAAKKVVKNGDVKHMSIWANELKEKITGAARHVVHGVINEVSLVIKGANPGARIEWVNLVHDGYSVVSDEEAIIHSGIAIEVVNPVKQEEGELSHASYQEIIDSFSPEQMEVFEAVVQHALDTGSLEHSAGDPAEENPDNPEGDPNADPAEENPDPDADPAEGGNPNPEADPAEENPEGDLEHQEGTPMTRKVFDQNGNGGGQVTLKSGELLHSVDTRSGGTKQMVAVDGELRHAIVEGGELKHTMTVSDYRQIVKRGLQMKSFVGAAQEFALAHGINDIELLFPDAKNYTNTPQWDKRRTEWVSGVLNAVSHTPYSRVKTLIADITQEEARARGYIKGNMKKEEWFGLTGRKTGPTTIYKKQKLDRDDIIDITDFDIIVWIKGEMRLMFEEEVARAILIGDGRPVEDPANPGEPNPDKVKEPEPHMDGDGVRSILNDNELFVTTVNVALPAADPDYYTIVEEVLRNRKFWKGSGTPTFYGSDTYITEMLLSKDGFGRRRFRDLQELANELRVSSVVPIELFDTVDGLIGFVVNLSDYNVGTDRGGELNFFDDFDIDFNQYKYLYESRFSGALVKIKSALKIMRTNSADTEVTPEAPTFNEATGVVTVPTVVGVSYFNVDTDTELVAGAQPALAEGETIYIQAVADSGYYFVDGADAEYEFTRPPA